MTMRRGQLLSSCLVALAAASGCQGNDEASGATNDDRVRTASVAWSDGDAWKVGAEPVLSIGRENGPDELRFNRIRRITTLPDGDILVVNGSGPPGLRVFNSDGSIDAAFGGQGAGPGEFGFLFDGWLIPPDTIVTFDYRLHRANWFLTNGEFIRADLLAQMMAQQMIVRGRYTNGSWLLAANLPEYEDRPEGRVTRRMLATGAPDGSSIDSIGHFDEMTRVKDGIEFKTPTFMPGVGTYVAIDDRLYAGYPEEYELEVRSPDGSMICTIRREDAARELTDEIFDAAAEARIEAAAPDRRARVRRDLLETARPDNLPAYSGSLAVDSDGNVWVQGFVLPWDDTAAWSVFDDRCGYVGDVHLPAAFTPMEITSDRMLGVWRDELDVETVRAYELTRN